MTNWSEGVSIIVPTFRRPKGVQLALESLRSQSAGDRPVEIIVADNAPEASARDLVAAFAETTEMPVVYVHVPEPGVSNVRNGAMAKARGRYIAFLDDDMEATPNWLSEFLRVSAQYKAGIVFLPAVAVMPNADDPRNPYMAPFFSRVFDAPEGLVDGFLGAGGSFLDLELCNLPSPIFDASRNETGGEDDHLFGHLIETGTRVAWSQAAVAYEHVAPDRATSSYIWTRNFAYGQGPTSTSYCKGISGFPGVAMWMAIGAGQFTVFGGISAVLRGLRQPSYIKYYAKAAQGLGKIIWWDGKSPRIYGAARLDKAVLE